MTSELPVTDTVERLRGVCVDWDGTAMLDGEEPRTWLSVGEIREAAAEIERLRAALLAERERCAKVAESIISADQYDTMDTDCYQDTADRIAAAIRNLQEPT